MAQKAFFLDMSRCTGCKTCVLACKDKNDLDVGKTFRKVVEYTAGETTRDVKGCISTTCSSYYFSLGCNHCDNPACVEICPAGSMQKDPETGLVRNDPNICIACGSCVSACPYSAPFVDKDLNYSRKCDGCADYVAAGETPVCVAACPARALVFGDVEKVSDKGVRLNIAPCEGPEKTNPNYYVKESRDALKSGDTTGHLANPLEVELGWYEKAEKLY